MPRDSQICILRYTDTSNHICDQVAIETPTMKRARPES